MLANQFSVNLRREFENPCPASKTVASRRSRGVYRRDWRPLEPSVVDSRGRMVRAVGMAQTFLSPMQVDELVALYEAGATLAELGEPFGVHRRTAAAHLVRRSVPIRRRGLDECNLAEAVELYAGGLTLMEVGLRFGVSQQASWPSTPVARVRQSVVRSASDRTSFSGRVARVACARSLMIVAVEGWRPCRATYSAINRSFPASMCRARVENPWTSSSGRC
jgi:hypothetical protein